MDSEYYERKIVNATFSTMPGIIPSNIHCKGHFKIAPSIVANSYCLTSLYFNNSVRIRIPAAENIPCGVFYGDAVVDC